MGKFGVFTLIVAFCCVAQASWYWPFDSGEIDEKPKRVSELIEPASLLIEEASDLAADDKTDEAVEKYRKALVELDRVELENPDRAKSSEFATLRNKRAYVNAAIDALLLEQVQANAKAVSVSDTTELEKRLDRERWGKRMDEARKSLDHCNPSLALAEFEKAKKGTTNAVLVAATHVAIAGAYCQKGAFEDACRSLVLTRKELVRAGALTDEERRLLLEFLRTLRSGVVVGYGKALSAGRRARGDLTELEAMDDLTTSNAVARAGDVVRALRTVRDHAKVFAFPAAKNLSLASSNLQQCVSALLGKMESGKQPAWSVNVSGFESALKGFGAFLPKVKNLNTVLAAVFLTAEGEVKEEKKGVKKGVEPKDGEEIPPRQQNQEQTSSCQRPPKALTMREKVMVATAKGDWMTAERLIEEMLIEKPNGAVALNLKAALEARQGKFKEAESTLDQAILSNPRSHFAYYNMANLMLQVRADDKSVAKRYYETGRTLGGPVDARLEEAFK